MDSASTGLTPMTPAALARLAADADVGVVLAGAATPAPSGVTGPGGGGISGGTPPPYGCAPSAPIPIPARGVAGGRSAPVAIPRPGAAAAVAGEGDPMALMADVAAACGREGVGAPASVVDDAVVAAGAAGAVGAAAGAGGLAAASAPAAFSMLTASPGSTCDGASVASRSPFSVGGGGGGLGGASVALLAAAGGGGGTAGNGGSTAGSPYTSSLPLPLYAGSFSSIDDEHVTVWEPATGKTVAGNAAPYRRNLSTWLLTHGGWEEKADELKSSKRRSAARRAKAASASFANLCVCTPVVAALLADARQRAAVVAAAPADEAKGAGDTAATPVAALAASAATPGTSPVAGVGHLPYASEWPADLRVRLQEALVRLGEETHAAGREMGTLHPERWRALTASVGGGKTEDETLAMTIDVLSRGLAVHAHATASLASFGGPAGSSGSLPESSHGSLDMSGLVLLSALGGDEARNLSVAGGGLATASAAVSAANGGAAAATGAANGTAGILSTSPAVGHSPLSSSVPAGGDFLGSLAGGFRTAREPRVTVWEPATGRTLSGNAAPCRRNLGAWMSSHPGWLPKAEEQLSSSRRARNRKSILGAGGVLTPLEVLGGGADGDGDGDGGMDDDDGPDGGGGGAAADAGSGAATAAAATATPAMPIPVPGGGRSNGLPSAATLDAAELGSSVPLSPALSDALEGLLLMSGSSPGAAPGVSILSGAGGSLRGASFGGGSHLGGASVGGGSQFGGVSVGGGSSVGGVVEAMVNMSVAVEGVVPVGAGGDDDGARRERVLCGKRATPSSSSEHSSGFTEESGADTTPSADAMDDAGGEAGGGGRSWDRGGKGVPPDGSRRSKRISAASMSMDMEL